MSETETFSYTDSPYPIRDDLVAVNRRAWRRLAAAGAWFSGAERVGIAAETRAALDCDLCRERKAALSPNSVSGEHDRDSELEETVVDVVHRVTTDASRLSRDYIERLSSEGLAEGAYVEIVGVVVTVLSIDWFHRCLGLPLEELPTPLPGEPTRRLPDGIVRGEAWVPMLSGKSKTGPEADLYEGLPMAPNVLRALSAVPDEVRTLKDLSGAYYLHGLEVADPSFDGGRAIDRAQMELVAARVSALNECFY